MPGSVLAVGAHPDDITLGAGGLLARLAALGYDVTCLSMTSGELGGSARDREREEERAARILGATVAYGRLEDGNIGRRDAVGAIAEHVRRLRPCIVLAHDPSDTHQDHAAIGRAALVACRNVPNLLFYEGPSTVAFEPTTVVDVGDTWQTKLRALEAYGSQMDARRLLAWVRSAANFRAWPRHVGAPCEAYRIAHVDLALAGVVAVRDLATPG